MSFWKCPQCHGNAEKIGEHPNGMTATYKCQREKTCGHVFVMPNVRKVVSIPGMKPGGRDFSAAVDHCKALQERMEAHWGRQGAQNVMKYRMHMLKEFMEKQGIRSGADFLAALRESQSRR